MNQSIADIQRRRDRRRVGILGGTFDPIHQGHLAAVEAVRPMLWLEEVLLIPSHTPPHRPVQHASAFHRFAMTALAANTRDGLVASDIELRSNAPSFTGSTLKQLHAVGLHPSQLFFIIGSDAFAEIATWKDFPAILDWSHFVVVSRPGHPLGRMVSDYPPEVSARLARPETLESAPSTTVLLAEISTPDVSSTEIRQRVESGQPVTGLVSPAVELHIRKHRLYSREPSDGSHFA